VTSEPLGEGAALANRLFPKTRSWLALGAPLELLSPLSILRGLFAMGTLLSPAVALAQGTTVLARVALLAVVAGSGLIWLLLLRVRTISHRRSVALIMASVVGVALLVGPVHGSAAKQIDLVFLIPLCIFAGLFFGARAMITIVGLLAAAVWLTRPANEGIVSTAFTTLATTIVAGSVVFIVNMLARSARERSTVDADTGLPNGFGLARRTEISGGYESFIVAAIALTGLPEVREALGYQAGTELLRRAVEDLGQVLPSGATIGRIEGDELIVIVPVTLDDAPTRVNAAGGELAATGDELRAPSRRATVADITGDAERLAQLVVDTMANGRYLIDGIEVPLGSQVGLALAPWDGRDVSEVVRRATSSVRRAVGTGQSYRMWDGSHEAVSADDLAMLAELRHAGERGELRLAYQPQVAAASGRTVAVEALLRWTSPTRGAVSPGRFIPLAERTGLIGFLTDWALQEALDAQVRWRQHGIEVPVSVNLSAKVLGRHELARQIVAELERRDLPPAALTVEITETAAIGLDVGEVVRLLAPLHSQGIRVSMDDFGTGYTSLAVLPHLPLDELKVDLGFVIRSATSPADEAIVRSVRELAHRLGLEVVAEGVEDEECAARMTSYGFDLLQGYHFSRPLDEPELLAFLATHAIEDPPSEYEKVSAVPQR
jgi:predicted signal transduction protein with EAL and GGDEF domain